MATMYTILLFAVLAFFGYTSAQAECDACVQASRMYNQSCAQYYEQTDETVIVTTQYYNCLCSLTDQYSACYKCQYDEADYQSWSDDWTFTCDTYANQPDTTYTFSISPTDSYSVSAYPTESLTAGSPTGTLSSFSFSVSFESTIAIEQSSSELLSTVGQSAPETASGLSGRSSTTAPPSTLITSTTLEDLLTSSTSAPSTTSSGAAGVLNPSWSFACGLLFFLMA
ncbi:hypothetical protein V1506DRAFT_509628 [Lipomyces tetrasporus]